MEDSTAGLSTARSWKGFLRTIALVFLVPLVLFGLLAGCQATSSTQATATSAAIDRLSAEELETQYGLRVRLIGVTAGGGMIDFRLKVMDAEKARQLLLDSERRPSLIAAKSGVVLSNPTEEQDELTLVDDGILFALFPNSGGAIQPGDEVIVAFGDLQLEPMPAQ